MKARSICNAACNPWRKIGVSRGREKAAVRLLAGERLLWNADRRRYALTCVLPLALTLSLPPMVGLSLLAVIKQKSERASKTENDQTFRNAVINIFKEAVTVRHGFSCRWLGEVIITVTGTIIWM